jgi:predicted nucleotidyltransferase
MNRQEVIGILRQHADTLRSKGVSHAALFGSVARGDNRPDSDIDILVDIDPAAGVTVFDYVALKDYIASLFEGHVDVVDREALKPHLRSPSLQDKVDVF